MPAYDNFAVAAILDRMGDLVEVAGGDRFRALSYHKAAHVLRAWPEALSAMAADGRLTEVPGIGVKLAVSIGQILDTGTFPELEELRGTFPTSLVEVLEIPGIGPKKARILHDEVGVTSLDDVAVAIAEGRLADLPGFGAKTVANIEAGIEAYRRHHERILLFEALPLAEAVAEDLRALPGVRAAEPAGSIRRMQETIGDIDVLVSADEPPAVMEAVRALPLTSSVIGSGPSKTSVLTTTGLQVDVRVVEPGQWGAALQYFTGGKEHNVRLREIAKRRGLKISEYGVFRTETGERVAGASEEEVYAALGMPTPQPEIRQNSGEIEEMLEGRLPDLVALTDVRGDFHTHTKATDGRSTLEQNRARAAELGYEYVAATDHAANLKMTGMDIDALERQWEEIDRLNETPGPHVLKGIELNIDYEGGVDYAPDVLARFDICLASLHSGWGQPSEVATRRVLRAMENPYVDVVSHLTGRILGRRDPIDLDVEAILAKAAETGTIMEVNAFPDRLDLRDVHLRAAKRFGVRISIGTDAHEERQMGYMSYGVATARRGWISAAELLNAQPLDTVRGWLKRSRA